MVRRTSRANVKASVKASSLDSAVPVGTAVADIGPVL